MAKFNWMDITEEDVIKAIDIFNKENPKYPEPKVTFLIYKNQRLPAKHIRGMAYKVAYGNNISKSDYGGGMETVKFFERLGFEMHYTGKSTDYNNKSIKNEDLVKGKSKLYVDRNDKLTSKTESKTSKIKIPVKNVIEQKNAMQLLLNKICDGDIVSEKTFTWLKTPDKIQGNYKKIYDSLHSYRGDTTFAKKNVQLRCDFVCESKKIIIEYDERQHFSEARKESLLSYMDIPLHYDRELWIKASNDIKAKDNNPFNRDETRAYYDSIRDIKASKYGYKLVRIMHGQIDFEDNEAEEKLRLLLGLDSSSEEKIDMINRDKTIKNGLKIGLYLQTDELKTAVDFQKNIEIIKQADFDIFVLPEFSYVPFYSSLINSDICNEEELDSINRHCINLSKEIGKAIVVSSEDKYGTIFSVYANAFADNTETVNALYIKHTMTSYSAFDLENYMEYSRTLFEPIIYKGYRIGMTICYDCNHSLFSRIYGLQNVDVILNSTGGNIVYDKWYKYNKVRAIENNCYNFVTMGGDGTISNPKAYVYGFNRLGKELTPKNILNKDTRLNYPGGIYVYDIDLDDGHASPDTSFYQNKTANKNHHLSIPVGKINNILVNTVKLTDDIYLYKKEEINILFLMINGKDILKPERVLSLLYSSKIKELKNKRYVIVNRYEEIKEDYFKNILSVILKVRAMENFCAVILESNNINECYQSGMNRTAQVLKPDNGMFNIDLTRTTGPEAIWKNKNGMRASWRDNFEWLINNMENI